MQHLPKTKRPTEKNKKTRDQESQKMLQKTRNFCQLFLFFFLFLFLFAFLSLLLLRLLYPMDGMDLIFSRLITNCPSRLLPVIFVSM